MVRRGGMFVCVLSALLGFAVPGGANAQEDAGCIAGCGAGKTPAPSCEAGCLAALPDVKLKATALDDGTTGAKLTSASVETVTEAKPVEAAPSALASHPSKGHAKGAHDHAPGAALHGNLSPLRY